jgi:hypothetical protein
MLMSAARATTFSRRAPSSSTASSSSSSSSLYSLPSCEKRTFSPSSSTSFRVWTEKTFFNNNPHFLQQPPIFSSSTSSSSILSTVGRHSFCETKTTKRWASGSSGGGGGGGRGSSIPPGTVFLNMPQGLSIPHLTSTSGNLSLSGLGGVVVGEEQLVGSSSKLQEEAQKRLKADQRRKAQQLRQAGLEYFSGRQFGLAKQLLTKAASLRDDDMGVNFVAEMLRYIAFADINEGNFGEAIVTLDTYQKIKARMVTNKTGNDELVAIWLLLGATRLMGGCFTEATAHFQRAKDLLEEVTDKRTNNNNTNNYDDDDNNKKTPEEQEERMSTPSNFSKTAQSILDSLFEEQQPTTTRNPARLSLATLTASQQQHPGTGGVPYSVVLHTALSILSQTMPLIPLYKAQETLELYRLWETTTAPAAPAAVAATPQQLQKQKKKKGHQPQQVKGMITMMMMNDQEVGELATHLEKRASYLIAESKRNEGLLLLEEAVELLERVFEENKERVIGLVCKLAERYIYFRRTEKAKLLLQYWKQRNADSKDEEEERERLLEEQARVSSEEERLQEEQKWANNISLHKLDFQLPLHTLTTPTATTTITPPPPTTSPPSQPESTLFLFSSPVSVLPFSSLLSLSFSQERNPKDRSWSNNKNNWKKQRKKQKRKRVCRMLPNNNNNRFPPRLSFEEVVAKLVVFYLQPHILLPTTMCGKI